ncbi:MAG: ECF transporter S component [Streptococcaceae bacterium]|nr:ECF transporter S component [Streptococcaceae bacterium]MCL2681181.1 ECF transporter S component [Streptococcaceae bacterium]MCL2858434.1 ECF transporter S component [Streptococcaceae bacterium]
MTKKSNASDIAILSIMIALMIVIQLFSQIIYALWPIPIQPVLIHVPVIIGSILLGWRKGAFLGFIMGLILLINATMVGGITSFMFTPLQQSPVTHQAYFTSLIVTFVPRILMGILPYFVYKITKNKYIGSGVAAFAGTATNTVLVLGFILLFFGELTGTTFGNLITPILLLNSSVEVLVAVILTVAIVPALEKTRK